MNLSLRRIRIRAIKSPGVYIEELRALPTSVAAVETAIPAFIGYTEKAERRGENLRDKPTRIRSLAEYRSWFGEPVSGANFTIRLGRGALIDSVERSHSFFLAASLSAFYANGGGPCYVVSVGDYGDPPDVGDDRGGR